MLSTSYYCQILMELQFSRRNLEKYANIKSNVNPSIERLVLACWWIDIQTDERTDRQKERYDEANSRFPQFSKRT
jgi:hypothetical protein